MPKKKQRASNYIPINGSFLQLPHKTICSKEFNSLSFSSRCIYLVLLTKWNRDKNKATKEFEFTYQELLSTMRDINGKSPSRHTISEGLGELQSWDFLSITYGGRNNPTTFRINQKWLT